MGLTKERNYKPFLRSGIKRGLILYGMMVILSALLATLARKEWLSISEIKVEITYIH